jgi:hypothetical protein
VSAFHRILDPNNADNQIDVFIWPAAPNGEWRIRLTARLIRESGRVHAYIERAGGQQSRFVAGTETRTHTTGTICHGLEVISVAAYDPAAPDRRPADFSSSGPSRDGRPVPVCSAPGVNIRAARSSRASGGTRTRNELTVMDGTSMAAPHVAGVAALMLQASGPPWPTARQVRRVLTGAARQNPPASLADRLRYGAGRVDAAAAVRAIRDLWRAAATRGAEQIDAGPEEMPGIATPASVEAVSRWPPAGASAALALDQMSPLLSTLAEQLATLASSIRHLQESVPVAPGAERLPPRAGE